MAHDHYYRDVSHLSRIDIYRVLALYDVRHPAIQHAVKKLLMAGARGGGKDVMRDLREARDAITRALVMLREDGWDDPLHSGN